MTQIRKLLVANRGEIACRIMRTCRSLGITTVALFSDADAEAPHVELADEAVHIGASPSSESYLVVDRILEAARQSGAQAIHPGYGFLAENAGFARACGDAGVTFIGPTPEVIEVMGSKQAAKRMVREAGVPVVPGYEGEDQSLDALTREADNLGYPVLLKASAGGGGKGMHVVREQAELAAAASSAKRIAQSAFGDGTLILERYVDRPRHIEVQIFGDSHGNVQHLWERECTIQRRHQKIVEETPSTALDDELRQRVCEAAVAVGRTLHYQNAGTVEFILAPDGAFYFLEVNTRLQVEHPVTECVTGLDLVREQIRVAEGAALSFAGGDVPRTGAAIECRLYAEDADNGFLPSTGRILEWFTPSLDGFRVDTGVRTGSKVGIDYDPMLAKLVAHGTDRSEALQRMRYALEGLRVQGLKTNREFLLRVLNHPAFVAGDMDTHFIEQYLSESAPPDVTATDEALVAAVLAGEATRSESRVVLPQLRSGFRNNPFQAQTVSFSIGQEIRSVEYINLGDGRFRVTQNGECRDWTRIRYDAPILVLQDDTGRRLSFAVTEAGAAVYVHRHGQPSVALEQMPRFPERGVEEIAGGYRAPMPGKVISIMVEEGQAVGTGDILMIIEAMKMEQPIKAADDGTVERVLVRQGDQVDADAALIVVT